MSHASLISFPSVSPPKFYMHFSSCPSTHVPQCLVNLTLLYLIIAIIFDEQSLKLFLMRFIPVPFVIYSLLSPNTVPSSTFCSLKLSDHVPPSVWETVWNNRQNHSWVFCAYIDLAIHANVLCDLDIGKSVYHFLQYIYIPTRYTV